MQDNTSPFIKYYTPENEKFLRTLINDYLAKRNIENIKKEEIIDLYKTTNSKNLQLRLDILNNFKRISPQNNRAELGELKILFTGIEKNLDAKNFAKKAVERGLAVSSIAELNEVISETALHKANYFFNNVKRIVALSNGKERKQALKNELSNPFFKPKKRHISQILGIKDSYKSDSVLNKNVRYIQNKLDLILYNSFGKKTEPTEFPKIEFKQTTTLNDTKIKLQREVNDIIKIKLGKNTYNEQEDLYRLKTTKIRLSLLPEIFSSIKATRAQARRQSIVPQSSNRDAARLYELINGRNKKLVRYMLKQTDSNGDRIFDTKQIISFIERTNEQINNNRKLDSKYNALKARIYHEELYNNLVQQYGKLKRNA